LLGLRNVSVDSDATGHASALIAQTLSTANSMIQMGFEHQNLEIFSRALHALRFAKSGSAGRQRDRSPASVEGMGLGIAVSESVARIVGTDRQLGIPADPPEAHDPRKAELRATDIDAALHQEPVDSHEAKGEVPLLRAA
jgi:hypothetical protein